MYYTKAVITDTTAYIIIIIVVIPLFFLLAMPPLTAPLKWACCVHGEKQTKTVNILIYSGIPLFQTHLGRVLISGVVLYNSLCNWDRAWCPD